MVASSGSAQVRSEHGVKADGQLQSVRYQDRTEQFPTTVARYAPVIDPGGNDRFRKKPPSPRSSGNGGFVRHCSHEHELILCPLSVDRPRCFHDRSGALCRPSAFPSAIGRFWFDATFTAASLSDRVWSAVANIADLHGPEDDCRWFIQPSRGYSCSSVGRQPK